MQVGGKLVRGAVGASLLALLVACGGGGDAGSAAAPVSPAPPSMSPVPAAPAAAASAATAPITSSLPLVRLQGDAGDYIGGGATAEYDTTNAGIVVAVRGSYLSIQVQGRENWSGSLQLPGNATELQMGTYTGLARYPFQLVGAGGFSWSGQGRGCNTSLSTVTIDAVVYRAGVLRSLDMRFEQRCEGNSPALRGHIRIDEQAMALLSVPQNPLPSNPVVALRSDVGDYIGGGGYYAYDTSSAVIAVSATGNRLSVSVRGDELWNGEFQLPATATAWAPGTYTALTRYPFNLPSNGGLSWWGEGRGCNALNATMVVDSVRYVEGVLRGIDMRFEQRCEGGVPALNGTIRWDADQVTPEPAPLTEAPLGLWAPPDGTFAASGNAMYVSSARGDYIGQGYTWWVGAAVPAPGTGGSTESGTVTMSITEAAGLLSVNVSGLVRWSGEFKAMDGLQRLRPGFYGMVQRSPFHNPARGGLSWTMDSRGCNRSSGWFMIDSVTYEGSQLVAVDLRFSQFCDGSVAPLRGRIRWRTAGSAP